MKIFKNKKGLFFFILCFVIMNIVLLFAYFSFFVLVLYKYYCVDGGEVFSFGFLVSYETLNRYNRS